MFIFGFLFIIYIISAASVAIALVLAKWSRRSGRNKNRYLRPVSSAAIAVLAIVLMVYGTAAFIGYTFWCEQVRHVDSGFGDSWAAPVGNDYYFCMVDTTDAGELDHGSCFMDFSGHYDHQMVMSDITDLAQDGEKIIGKQKSGAFILDTGSGLLHKYSDIGAAMQDFSPSPSFHDANSFYFRNRWGLLDLEAAALICLPALGIILVWYQVVRRRKPSD